MIPYDDTIRSAEKPEPEQVSIATRHVEARGRGGRRALGAITGTSTARRRGSRPPSARAWPSPGHPRSGQPGATDRPASGVIGPPAEWPERVVQPWRRLGAGGTCAAHASSAEVGWREPSIMTSSLAPRALSYSRLPAWRRGVRPTATREGDGTRASHARARLAECWARRGTPRPHPPQLPRATARRAQQQAGRAVSARTTRAQLPGRRAAPRARRSRPAAGVRGSGPGAAQTGPRQGPSGRALRCHILPQTIV